MKLAQGIKIVRKVLEQHANLTPLPIVCFNDEFVENLNNDPMLRIIFKEGKEEALIEAKDKNQENLRLPLEL